MPDDLKHIYDTIYTHFQGITDNIYGFGRPFFARPYSLDGSLHKAMRGRGLTRLFSKLELIHEFRGACLCACIVGSLFPY